MTLDVAKVHHDHLEGLAVKTNDVKAGESFAILRVGEAYTPIPGPPPWFLRIRSIVSRDDWRALRLSGGAARQVGDEVLYVILNQRNHPEGYAGHGEDLVGIEVHSIPGAEEVAKLA